MDDAEGEEEVRVPEEQKPEPHDPGAVTLVVSGGAGELLTALEDAVAAWDGPVVALALAGDESVATDFVEAINRGVELDATRRWAQVYVARPDGEREYAGAVLETAAVRRAAARLVRTSWTLAVEPRYRPLACEASVRASVLATEAWVAERDAAQEAYRCRCPGLAAFVVPSIQTHGKSPISELICLQDGQCAHISKPALPCSRRPSTYAGRFRRGRTRAGSAQDVPCMYCWGLTLATPERLASPRTAGAY